MQCAVPVMAPVTRLFMVCSMSYDTDLTDAQWKLIRRHIPRAKSVGRPRTTNMRRVVDAIMYVVTHGCKWRGLPKDFPPWQSVYRHFDDLQQRGRIRRIQEALTEMVRVEEGKAPNPSLMAIDSQSVKTGKVVPNSDKGIDGGKNVRGHKRHMFVDSLGLPHEIVVTPANLHDTKGAVKVLAKYAKRVKLSRLKKLVADKGYRGEMLKGFVRKTFKARIKIGQNHTSPQRGFVPAEKRWVVERSFSWLTNFRRLAVDQERCLRNSCAMVRLAFIRIMLRRLCPS